MLTFNFKKLILENPNGLMLDLGCGEGRHIFGVMEEFPNLQCIGLDPHIKSLAKAYEGLDFLESISNKKTNFLSGSAYSLPFPDNSFDLVVCSEVLEHLHEYKNAIAEVSRVLNQEEVFLQVYLHNSLKKYVGLYLKIIKMNRADIYGFLIKNALLMI